MWDPLRALGALTTAWLLLGVVWEWAVWSMSTYCSRLVGATLGSGNREPGQVVTGVTDGLGRAYAHQFAKRGLNIVLISRNMNKLEKEAKEIAASWYQHVCHPADFTGGLEIYGAIEEGLKGLEIGVLVNNVGMNYSLRMEKLLDRENPAQRLSDIVNCNMMSVVQVTRIVLPQMVSRHRGIIVNVSSITENHPWPLLAVYSATKAFTQRLFAAVGPECLSEGVTIQTVSPGVVYTKLIDHPETGLLVKGSQDWAEQVVHTLGLSSHVSGCLSHEVQSFLIGLLPSWYFRTRWASEMLKLLASSKEKA